MRVRLSTVVTALYLAASGLAVSIRPGKQLAPRQATPTNSAAAAQSTICGDIIDEANQGTFFFYAADVYECFVSVPFNPAVASRFLKYFNETIQFHSSLAYLKNPPTGYQQPAVDVLAGLDVIQNRIDGGVYANQYAFEVDFLLLVQSMHDDHAVVVTGLSSAFSWASPYSIVSASVDGKAAPKVYLEDDIEAYQANGTTPSPLKTINGQGAVEYLTQYAAINSQGYIEPHADWNALMSSPALDIQGYFTPFDGSGILYPGEFLNFTREDGTKVDSFWVAIYNEEANITGPLTTGGDMYNFFVLGLTPASFVPQNNTLDLSGNVTNDDFTLEPDLTSWFNISSAYPEEADIYQADLSIAGGGVVTGYFFDDISTGVLSLPTFDLVGNSTSDFGDTVQSFIGNATNSKISKVVIDLQRNSGGTVLLAFTTFKQFFPDLVPFAGSRRRIFPMANTLGSVKTEFWESLSDDNETERAFKEQIASDEWVITDRLKAGTGTNFTSWDEYANGPTDNGDKFSLTEQYDLANEVFDGAAFDQWIPSDYLKGAELGPRPWAPDQIAILTDGTCSSACALFVEMMTRVGVKTVVAGGRPTTGPMQGAAGSRGAAAYSADLLDEDIDDALTISDDAAATLPAVRELDMVTYFMGFNLRDQIRENDKTPLQFRYEAADCRIYYTIDNVFNYTKLWRDAAAAIFDDNSRCVDGSTGFSTTNNTSPKPAPKLEAVPPIYDTPVLYQATFEEDPDGGIQAAKGPPGRTNEISLCDQGRCAAPAQCVPITVSCSVGPPIKVNACLPPCRSTNGGNSCPGISKCRGLNIAESKNNAVNGQSFGSQVRTGQCFPDIGTTNLGCPPNPRGR